MSNDVVAGCSQALVVSVATPTAWPSQPSLPISAAVSRCRVAGGDQIRSPNQSALHRP